MRAFVVLCLITTVAYAGKLPTEASEKSSVVPLTLEVLKLKKRFGIGISGGGPLSVIGIEADVNLSEELSLSAGLGTGIDYSTLMIKARYFLLGEWVSPYIGGGFAKWWTDGTKEKNVGPSVLANRFLEPGTDPSKGFNVFLIYPSVGVQLMNASGLSFFAEVQYLFRLFSFANGTYAGMGIHWYF